MNQMMIQINERNQNVISRPNKIGSVRGFFSNELIPKDRDTEGTSYSTVTVSKQATFYFFTQLLCLNFMTGSQWYMKG